MDFADIWTSYFRHYPTTKFTAVADTPENKRLAQNTKKQSNVSCSDMSNDCICCAFYLRQVQTFEE